MGKFAYESRQSVEIEDRALFHLQMVMTAKLRRGEPFTFTWKDDASLGLGRTAVWVHPGASLAFKYYGSKTPQLNRAWVDALMYTSNTPTGLYLVPEPSENGEPSGAEGSAG